MNRSQTENQPGSTGWRWIVLFLLCAAGIQAFFGYREWKRNRLIECALRVYQDNSAVIDRYDLCTHLEPVAGETEEQRNSRCQQSLNRDLTDIDKACPKS